MWDVFSNSSVVVSFFLEIHSLFQIPLWKASFGGSCFFSIKNPNLRNIQIVFIAVDVFIAFYHSVRKNSWYPFDQLWKDERPTRPWRYTMVFNTEPLDWGTSAVTSRPVFVFSLLIFNENEARYVILGTLTLLTIKNIINYFMCVGSLRMFQGSALKKYFLCYFSWNVSKRSILGLLGLNNFI